MVGKVGSNGLVAHAVSGGDEFCVGRADEIDQARRAQDSGLDADRTQRVLDIAVGGWRSCCPTPYADRGGKLAGLRLEDQRHPDR